MRAAGCVFAEDEAALLLAAAPSPSALQRMVEQRVAGLPLEQVIGWAEFCGLRIAVEPGVFVPRHRSALLVERAVAVTRPGAVMVDLCCGTGAIGAAIRAAVGDIELHAVDIDAPAVRCARRNLGDGAAVYQGDLYTPLPVELHGRVDVVVASTPYVPSDEVALLPREAREHEPLVALDGGGDGLEVVRRVAAEAGDWLRAGGALLVETSVQQSPAAAAVLAQHGLTPEIARDDDLEAAAITGRW